jgi:hypothetical protein
MAATTEPNSDLGPLFVALGKGSTAVDPLYMLVKHDLTTSYLPAWFSKAEVQHFIDSRFPGKADPTPLTRAGFERTKQYCANLGHQLFLKLGDV